MSAGRRVELLKDHPLDLGQEVCFSFEGRPITGFSKEPLSSALLASGVRVFGRSIKYHRPRGPLCMRASCSGCLMRVDGLPNIRTCETFCREGLQVERQLGWPSSGFDAFRAVDWMTEDPLDHHGMFTASGTLNRLAGKFIRNMAGYGDPPTANEAPPAKHRKLKCDVVIVGAGVSGLHAANRLAGQGIDCVLFEREAYTGGRLLDGAASIDDQRAWSAKKKIADEIQSKSGVEIHTGTPVLSTYPGKDLELIASNEKECFQVQPKRLLLCTGAYEQVPLFENNDLPGILSLRALDKLFCLFAVVPAEPIALSGDSEATFQLALLLAEQGVSVSAVITATKAPKWREPLQNKGIALFESHGVVGAKGQRWVKNIVLTPITDPKRPVVIEAQCVAFEGSFGPAYELAHHAGCRVRFDSQSGYKIAVDERGQTSHAQIFAAGRCTGASSMEEAALKGEQAGLACTKSLGD